LKRGLGVGDRKIPLTGKEILKLIRSRLGFSITRPGERRRLQVGITLAGDKGGGRKPGETLENSGRASFQKMDFVKGKRAQESGKTSFLARVQKKGGGGTRGQIGVDVGSSA